MKDSTLKSIWWACFIFAIANLLTFGFGFLEIYRMFSDVLYPKYGLFFTLFLPDFIAIAVMIYCEKKLKIKEKGIIL